MNILYYSYNFFPQADAESYCATRFASALARAGHKVTVVTMEWQMQVSDKTYKALVAEELDIVRIPFSKKVNSPIKALLKYGHKSQMAVDVPQSVKVVKKLLRTMENPILLTRTHPVMCTMVGLKTCDYASKWIAHFSDPIPWYGQYSDTLGHKLLKHQEKNILRKAFKRADGISVTCMHVCKFYKQFYGKDFDEKKAFMTTHIGDYRLDAPPTLADNENLDRVLLHPGSIFAFRGGLAIVDVMKQLEEESFSCKFVQVGEVDASMQGQLVSSKNVDVFNTISPEKSVELRKLAKATLVLDFESELPYSPYILSKFVYQLMTNKPIVLYSKRDCEMCDYAMQYPEAGIFWAEAENVESLKSAIKDVMDYDATKIDRTRIRKVFSEETVVHNFCEAVKRLW